MSALDIDRSRLGWVALGAVLAGALLFVAYSFVGTFVFGIFLYYATRPLYDRLKRRSPSRSLAAAVAILALALPALLLFAYTLAIGVQELNAFIQAQGTDIGAFGGQFDQYVNVSQGLRDPISLANDPDIRDNARVILSNTNRYLGLVGTGLLHAFIMLALAFYLLRDGPRLSRFARHRFGDDRGILDAYFDAVDRDFQSVFFGNILNAIMTGIIGAAAYSTLNLLAPAGLVVPYPFLLGLLTGVASLIPVVGMKLVYVPVSLLLVARAFPEFEGIWFIGLFAGVSFLIVDTLPDLVLRPYVSGRNLHVGSVMFAYIFGPLLFGWYGIFLGPLILVLVVHFAKLVLPELTEGTPIRPYAIDPSAMVVDDGPAPTGAPESPDPAETEPTPDGDDD